MTKFQLLNHLEKAGLLRHLMNDGIISKHIFMRYERYKDLMERLAAHPEEKRALIIMDWANELDVSIQSIYMDIRSMEKQIL